MYHFFEKRKGERIKILTWPKIKYFVHLHILVIFDYVLRYCKTRAFCLKVLVSIRSRPELNCMPYSFYHMHVYVMYVWVTTLFSPDACATQLNTKLS